MITYFDIGLKVQFLAGRAWLSHVALACMVLYPRVYHSMKIMMNPHLLSHSAACFQTSSPFPSQQLYDLSMTLPSCKRGSYTQEVAEKGLLTHLPASESSSSFHLLDNVGLASLDACVSRRE